jgi:pyruvate dehydrogenase E2 component (dihydrolipoamide acetyltransferase)
MAIPVEMPQLGNTVEECLLTRWLKQEGDQVSAGDMVAEIETDKTTFEVIAPVDGTLLVTFFDEGALVPVFTNIFVIGEPGEDVDAFRPGSAAPGTVTAALTEPTPANTAAPERAAPERATPAFSPRASRFAAAHGFHPATIVGSGPGGRVLERDLRRAYEGRVGEPRASEQRAASREPRSASLRATIARRMRESLATTAQYTLHSSADATGLLALRARLKKSADGAAMTINDLVTFCAIRALVDRPELNAEFVDGRLVAHAEVHIAFAVDTPRGLIAPVVRNAHTLSIADLARRMKEQAGRATDGTVSNEDLHGATFTISNLGGLGIESFTPIVNPPQVAILGVDAIQLKPVLREGAVSFVDAIGLSLTCDHQVIDGAPGARFLQVLREKIERVEELIAL